MNAVTEAKLKEYRLSILKSRLLLRLLDEISDTNLHAAVTPPSTPIAVECWVSFVLQS